MDPLYRAMLKALSACPEREIQEIAKMSVASGFRRKWGAIAQACDETRGQSDDARYTAMSQAARGADVMLLDIAAFTALAQRIKALEGALCNLVALERSQTPDMSGKRRTHAYMQPGTELATRIDEARALVGWSDVEQTTTDVK